VLHIEKNFNILLSARTHNKELTVAVLKGFGHVRAKTLVKILRGGALVKILKIMTMVALLGLTGSVALADGGPLPDPTVRVRQISDPTCNTDGSTPAGADYTCFSSTSQQDPIKIPTGTEGNFVFDGTAAQGTFLWVEILPTELGAFYTCAAGDVFASCQGPAGSADAGAVEFYFFGGQMTAGEEIGVSAPEPKAILLLMAALLPLVAFRKRFASNLGL
jgi:hypothetical protein